MAKNGRGRYVSALWEPAFAQPGRKGAAGRYRAFVPDPVGDLEPELSASTSALSERAGAAVRELNASAAGLLPLEGLGRQLLRSEALASSAIEGLQLSHRRLARAEVEGRAGDFLAQEVLGNARAMEEAVRMGREIRDLSVDDVCAIHRALAISPPLDRIAGRIRESQGWIGGASPVHAAFVPPPHESRARADVEDLCEFMNRDDVSPVAQAAIAHAQFETIHPFGDGNGRVGRCLIHVLFERRGIAPRYVPPVSLVLGANKDAYIAGLEDFRADEVDRWVAQFAHAVEIAAERGERLLGGCCQPSGASGSARRADAHRRHRPSHRRAPSVISDHHRADCGRLTGRSSVATINGLDHLARAGILTRHRNQRKGDSWEAKELFSLLEGFEESVAMAGAWAGSRAYGAARSWQDRPAE